MDLDSPFPKVVLLRDGKGSVEEREVLWVKQAGESLEMETIKGTRALFPRTEVVAILPRLPTGQGNFKPDEVDRVVAFLEGLSAPLNERAEASRESLQKWRNLKNLAKEAQIKLQQEEKAREQEKVRQEQDKVRQWLQQATDFQTPRSASEIENIKREGRRLLESKVSDAVKVQDGLVFLSQMVEKEKGGPLPELAKVKEIQAQLAPEDSMVWMALGILALSFFGLLIGLGFVSSGFTRMREGAWLGGGVFGGTGIAILGCLVMLWWPTVAADTPMAFSVSPEMGKVVICAKNGIRPAYYFPRMEFSVPAQEFVAGVLASMPPSEESSGALRGKLKEGELWAVPGGFVWRQPVVTLGIPLPVNFIFQGKNPAPESWREVELDQVFLGKVIIPGPVGSILCEAMKSTMQKGVSAAGFSGIQIKPGMENQLLVITPSSGKKPEMAESVASVSSPAYRREITAEDLAKRFVENKGGEFYGKFVVIEGVVDKISSGGEYSGVPSAGQGDPSSEEKRPAKIKNDTFDIFYLRGMESYGFRNNPLFIKIIVKSPDVFVMDTYGDIYKGPSANTVKDKPFIKKGYRVKFLKEGRVQSGQIKNNEIEVYGVEVSGEGDVSCFDPSSPPPH